MSEPLNGASQPCDLSAGVEYQWSEKLKHSGLGVRKEHGPNPPPPEAWGSMSTWVPSYTSGSALDIIRVTLDRCENAGLKEGNPEAGWAPTVAVGSSLCSPPEPVLLGECRSRQHSLLCCS